MDNKSLSHKMEMPISHCIYPEIQKENIVWKSEK